MLLLAKSSWRLAVRRASPARLPRPCAAAARRERLSARSRTGSSRCRARGRRGWPDRGRRCRHRRLRRPAGRTHLNLAEGRLGSQQRLQGLLLRRGLHLSTGSAFSFPADGGHGAAAACMSLSKPVNSSLPRRGRGSGCGQTAPYLIAQLLLRVGEEHGPAPLLLWRLAVLSLCCFQVAAISSFSRLEISV